MANHGLPELLQARYDERESSRKDDFYRNTCTNDILLDLYLYIMNDYLATKLNA
jgi:hypothetical protein